MTNVSWYICSTLYCILYVHSTCDYIVRIIYVQRTYNMRSTYVYCTYIVLTMCLSLGCMWNSILYVFYKWMRLYHLFKQLKVPKEPLMRKTNWNVFLTVHGTGRSTVSPIKLEDILYTWPYSHKPSSLDTHAFYNTHI